jgi:hypothetical protein
VGCAFKPAGSDADTEEVSSAPLRRRRATPLAVVVLLVLATAACTPDQRDGLALKSQRGAWLAVPPEVPLPPLPDPQAAAATLAGVDANGDGVRDDVELLIASAFRDPQQVAALRRVAVSVQKTLVVGWAIAQSGQRGEVPLSWLPAAKWVMRGNVMAGACVAAVFGAYEDASVERTAAARAQAALDRVVRAMLDTDERRAAYGEVERLLSGDSAVIKPLEAAVNPCE